jgi:hypothetical protein
MRWTAQGFAATYILGSSVLAGLRGLCLIFTFGPKYTDHASEATIHILYTTHDFVYFDWAPLPDPLPICL